MTAINTDMNELVKYVYNCMIVCTIPRLTLECDEDSGLDFHCPASLLLDEDNQVHVYYIYMHKLCTCRQQCSLGNYQRLCTIVLHVVCI